MFLTYDEQINNLRKNGLIIKDKKEAELWLKKEGYYNLIKGYSGCFKPQKTNLNINKRYFVGTQFSEICSLYRFDKNLNTIIYKYATKIENNIKAILAHVFSKQYGVDHNKYLNKSNFTNDISKADYVDDLIKKCNKTILEGSNSNKKSRLKPYINHYINKYGYVPLWVLIRALTFGNVSIFISLLKKIDKQKIANEYNLSISELDNMLEMLVVFRNIVAHGERLFCTKLIKLRLNSKMKVFDNMSMPKNAAGDPKYGRCDFLSILIILKYFLDPLAMSGLIVEVDSELDFLKKNISNTVFGIVKIEMGLNIGSWKKLNIING